MCCLLGSFDLDINIDNSPHREVSRLIIHAVYDRFSTLSLANVASNSSFSVLTATSTHFTIARDKILFIHSNSFVERRGKNNSIPITSLNADK